MAYQEITGGDGTTGQTGEVVKDIINENFVELYAAVEEVFSRAFTETLLFDKPEIYYTPYVQTGDINFTLAVSGHLVNNSSGARMTIVFDGVSSINFSSEFNELIGVQNGDVIEAGTFKVYFLYVNGEVSVNIPGVSSQSSGLQRLSTPGSFEAVADGENAIDLTWTDVADEIEYQIEKSLTGTSGWVLLSNPAAGSTSYSDTGLNPGDSFYYRIKALGDGVSHNDSLYATDSATTENSGDTDAPVPTFTPANGVAIWTVNRPIIINLDEYIRKADGTELVSNAAGIIVVKETNSGGADIPISWSIDVSKTVITIVPTGIYGDSQVVYVAIQGVEDTSGNEMSLTAITFTTTDWSFFNGTSNRLSFGDILDSVISIDNTNFEFEFKIRNHLTVGTRIYVAKSDPTGNQRCFVLYSVDTDIYFNYHQGGTVGTGSVNTKWAGALTSAEQTIELEYNGNVDTNYGLDRVTLKIGGVTQGSKTTTNPNATVTWYLFNSNAHLALGLQVNSAGNPSQAQYFSGEMKDFIFRSNSGATTNISVPIIADGEDVSGNNLDGTWV
jgi:hypothetical protein